MAGEDIENFNKKKVKAREDNKTSLAKEDMRNLQ
jgi:hypothetical protein